MLVRSVRDDAECVYAVAHQRGDRRVDHPMPLELRTAGERRGHERHPVMPTLPRAGVTGVQGAVIDHLYREGRERLLEGGADLAGGGGVRRRFRFLGHMENVLAGLSGLGKKVAYHSVFWGPSISRTQGSQTSA